VLALPGTLALLATGRLRRRWPVLLLCLGALVGVATGLGRVPLVGAVVAVLAFTALSLGTAGRRVNRPLGVLLGLLLLAVPLGAIFVSFEGGGTFSRYTELAPENVSEVHDTKINEVKQIPRQIAEAPFGVGLGTVGAAAGFGGVQKELLNGHGTGAESQYKFVLDELGLPGLLLWLGLLIRVLLLMLPRLRRVPDFELRMDLAAIVSPLIAMAVMGFSGPVMSDPALGPYYWFVAGVAAYWCLGPGRLFKTSTIKVAQRNEPQFV
jgi:O-antigen ligase